MDENEINARSESECDDPLFQNFMDDRIKSYWIPFVQSLEIAKGRSAYWNEKKCYYVQRQ